MRRLAAAVLAILTLAVFGGLFRNTVEMTGADMAVDVPAGWRVLTREDAKSETSAAMFGMTSEDAVKMMEDGDFFLILYEPKTGAEMYVTIFGSQYAAQLRSLSSLSEAEMDLAKEDVLQDYPGWEFDSAVTDKQLGDFTYLAATLHTGQGEERMDNRQLFTVYDGVEIYIDLYAKNSGLLETHAAAQDAVAESLQVEYAMQKAAGLYNVYVAVLVGVLMMVLVQFVGLALTLMVRIRERMG